MNIKMQCCGMVLLLVILYFFVHQKKLRLNTGIAFLRLIIMMIIADTLDIASVIVLRYHDRIPVMVIDLICKAYVSALLLTAFSSLLYVCRDIYVEESRYLKHSRIFTALACIGIVLILFTPIGKSYDNPDYPFTYGPSVIVTYFFCLGFFCTMFIFMISRKKSMNKRRWESAAVLIALWIGSSLLQFFVNELLLVSFMGSVGIIIIYLKLENPETNLDQRSGLFNRNALRAYIRQLYGKKTDFAILGMFFTHSMSISALPEENNQIWNELTTYLQNIPNAYAFRSEEDEILIIFHKKESAKDYFSIVKNRFEFGWGDDGQFFLRPSWIYVPDAGSVAHHVDDMLYLIRQARLNSGEYMTDNTLRIDEAVVEGIYSEKVVEQLIVSALEEDRVDVFYQPIYSFEKECFISAEALVRLRDKDGEIIPPDLFIGVAEKNGSMLELGERIFEIVCRFIRDEKPQRYGLEYVEVNLSGVQCRNEHLAGNLIHIMETYGISPQMINLEITESAAIGEKKTLFDNMERLIEYGVSFSLDDFGTGQSNLNYIVELPVQIVKFDRSMILSYFANGKAKYVMEAAMHMIQGMKLRIVSEGIETAEQLETMRQLGIDYIQGYYFSRPLARQDFMKFISRS